MGTSFKQSNISLRHWLQHTVCCSLHAGFVADGLSALHQITQSLAASRLQWPAGSLLMGASAGHSADTVCYFSVLGHVPHSASRQFATGHDAAGSGVPLPLLIRQVPTSIKLHQNGRISRTTCIKQVLKPSPHEFCLEDGHCDFHSFAVGRVNIAVKQGGLGSTRKVPRYINTPINRLMLCCCEPLEPVSDESRHSLLKPEPERSHGLRDREV